MSTDAPSQLYEDFSGGGMYRILVDGQIDPALSERLGGLRVEGHQNSRGTPETWLAGHIRDQAELLGVLNAVYDMGLRIVRLEATDDDETNSTRG